VPGSPTMSRITCHFQNSVPDDVTKCVLGDVMDAPDDVLILSAKLDEQRAWAKFRQNMAERPNGRIPISYRQPCAGDTCAWVAHDEHVDLAPDAGAGLVHPLGAAHQHHQGGKLHERHAMDLGAEPRQDVSATSQRAPLVFPPKNLKLFDRLSRHLE